MSTDPTSIPPVPAPVPYDPPPFKSGGAFADFAVSNRTTIAYILVALGLACLGGSIWCFTKVDKADDAIKAKDKEEKDKDKEKDKEKKVEPDSEKEKDKDKAKDKEAKSKLVNVEHLFEYSSGAFFLLFGAVFSLGVAAYSLSATPKLTYAESLTDARKTVLLAGALIGALLMAGGLWFAAYYFTSLTLALDKGKLSELKWVVGPLAVVLLGGGLLFLAMQPARAEERHNDFIRKLIYGSNFALTTFLIMVILIVINIIVAIKVPNKLDTTESGLYSLELNPATKEYLGGLKKPVKVYAILPESDNPVIADTLRLLDACAEANPSKFKVRKLSPTYDTKEIRELRNKYPQLDPSDLGLLFTLEDDDKQAGFVRLDEMVKQDFDQATRRSKTSFEGESKIARELLALNEAKTKAIIYCTTGHRELSVVQQPPTGRPDENRTAMRLRAALEQANVEIRPLAFDLTNPKVPDDASVVLIANPRDQFPKNQADAIQKYMSTPRPDGSHGKLILLTSPYPRADGTGLEDTGLTGLAAYLGVDLGQAYLYNQLIRNQPSLGYSDVVSTTTRDLLVKRNPIALAQRNPVILTNCREVTRIEQYSGPFVVEQLLLSTPPNRLTWLETSPSANPGKTVEQIFVDKKLQQDTQATNDGVRGVGVLVSESSPNGPIGRAIVIGSGEAFADPDAQNRSRFAEMNSEFMTSCVNWTRDRPAVANIPAKNYGEYQPPKVSDNKRLIGIPFVVTFLGVIALGTGVWVSRRK